MRKSKTKQSTVIKKLLQDLKEEQVNFLHLYKEYSRVSERIKDIRLLLQDDCSLHLIRDSFEAHFGNVKYEL